MIWWDGHLLESASITSIKYQVLLLYCKLYSKADTKEKSVWYVASLGLNQNNIFMN